MLTEPLSVKYFYRVIFILAQADFKDLLTKNGVFMGDYFTFNTSVFYTSAHFFDFLAKSVSARILAVHRFFSFYIKYSFFAVYRVINFYVAVFS